MARSRRTAVETDNDEETTDTESEETSASDETNGDGDAGDNGLEGRIRAIVREVVGPLLESGSGSSRRPDDEQSMTTRVKAALDQVKAEEDKDNRVKKLEETLQKVTERPPARSGILGKVQRVMWGEE